MTIIMTLMVGAEGMLTNDMWERLTHAGREGWLASLDDIHVRAQASVRAVAVKCTVTEMIDAWAVCGYLTPERAASALVAEIRQ